MDAIKKTKGTYRLRIHLSSSEYSSLELLQQYKRERNLSIALGQAGRKERSVTECSSSSSLFSFRANQTRQEGHYGRKKKATCKQRQRQKQIFGKKREGKTGPVFANP